MAEHRAIKSAIWDDVWFGKLQPLEMAVWIGLFSKCADDQGRLQDDIALIRSKIFPYRDVPLKRIETAMNNFGIHLIRYEKGERLAQLVRWFDNQPMQYAVPSNFPPPDGWIDRYRTTYRKELRIIYNWPGQANTQLGELLWNDLSSLGRPSSWIIYLDHLNPIPIPNPIPNPVQRTTTRENGEFDLESYQTSPEEKNFLAIICTGFSRKFANSFQVDTVLKMRAQFGEEKVFEALRWYASKGIDLDDAITRAKGALPTWGQGKKNGHSTGPAGPEPVGVEGVGNPQFWPSTIKAASEIRAKRKGTQQ